MAEAVGAGLGLRSPGADYSVEIDEVMVTDRAESASAMPRVYVADCYRASGLGGRAVDDDFCDFSHSIVIIFE